MSLVGTSLSGLSNRYNSPSTSSLFLSAKIYLLDALDYFWQQNVIVRPQNGRELRRRSRPSMQCRTAALQRIQILNKAILKVVSANAKVHRPVTFESCNLERRIIVLGQDATKERARMFPSGILKARRKAKPPMVYPEFRPDRPGGSLHGWWAGC